MRGRNELVRYWSDGEANFVTSAMEETGTFQSITYLDNAGLVDKTRFLVLRGEAISLCNHLTLQPHKAFCGNRMDMPG